MTHKTKLSCVFRPSAEQLETRVNLSATAHGVDHRLYAPTRHVAQVNVVPHSHAVVVPLIKAAVATTVTIPAVGQSGTLKWNWQSDHSLKVQIGNLQGQFTSVSKDGWQGQFAYKVQLAGGTSLTHFFNISFSHDRDAAESTLTYDDAKNHLGTTFDEAAAVITSGNTTEMELPYAYGRTEVSSVSGRTVSYTPEYAAPPPPKSAKAWQETSNANGSTTVTSTKLHTLGSTLDDVKALMTSLKGSLDKSFKSGGAVPIVAPPVAPLGFASPQSPTPAPVTVRVPLAVGWNAIQAVQGVEGRTGIATAFSVHLANQSQARSASTSQVDTFVSLSSSSQTVDYSASLSQLSSGDGWLFEIPSGDVWNNQIYNFTGPSTATSGTSRLLIQTEGVEGPTVSGYSTTPTGTYSFQFTNETTGAVYTINFTVTS